MPDNIIDAPDAITGALELRLNAYQIAGKACDRLLMAQQILAAARESLGYEKRLAVLNALLILLNAIHIANVALGRHYF